MFSQGVMSSKQAINSSGCVLLKENSRAFIVKLGPELFFMFC